MDATDAAECRTACETTARAALVMNPDTTSGQDNATTTANNGGDIMGVYASDASAAWCGGFTWDDDGVTATEKCQLLLGSDAPQAPAAATGGDQCGKMTTVKAFADLNVDLFTAWGDVTNSLYTNLGNAADSQAALEKAWLQAWYEQQYWAQIK